MKKIAEITTIFKDELKANYPGNSSLRKIVKINESGLAERRNLR